jgi:hypothetical protein
MEDDEKNILSQRRRDAEGKQLKRLFSAPLRLCESNAFL